MKKNILYIVICLLSIQLFGQDPDRANELISAGVMLHDKGDYTGAIAKYDEALKADENNLMALSEKAYSLNLLEKYEECIACCKKAIAEHPNDTNLNTVYISYGNALDMLGKPSEAIDIYNEGLAITPRFYLLHYNKGITLIGQEKADEALQCFQVAVLCNPKHASSHNAIGRIMQFKKKRIPALLAYCRFFTIEPTGPRAEENLERVKNLMSIGVKKTGLNSITINIDASTLGDTTEDGKPNENSFSTADLLLSMSSALSISDNKKMNDAEKFAENMRTLISSMDETKADNYGFFWEYYVPYFIEMKEKKHLETFAYIVFLTSNAKPVKKWVKSHEPAIQDFITWSESYTWKTE